MAKISNHIFSLLNRSQDSKIAPPIDGEILYCKNNVCIHPPSILSHAVVHYPGFLCLCAKVHEESLSLVLDWKPCKTEYKTNSSEVLSDSSKHTADASGCISGNVDISENLSESTTTSEYKATALSDSLASINDIESDKKLSETINHDHYDTQICEPEKINTSHSPYVVHNFQFPENYIHYEQSINSEHSNHVIRPPREQAFGAFNVDLSNMRSLRLYFRNEGWTTGEMVIASKDAQYKILHFHDGGLDCVAAVLKEWQNFTKCAKALPNEAGIHSFSIIKPQLTAAECHPEETLHRGLNEEMWALCKDEFGRIQNEQNIMTAIFFGGIQQSLRSQVWPFLLKLFPFGATVVERENIRSDRYHEYEDINDQKEALMKSNEMRDFFKSVACSVEKDVLRTDRANPFYQGEGNPNLETLKRILLNYSAYTKTGYTQGMSDLLSPLLIELSAESDAFWCFVGLMQRTIFISSPSDADMEKQLLYLRELLKLLYPEFHAHLIRCGPGALELLFTHRWILLCFKREFSESESLAIWEACWTHYQTNYFHLFVCVAIIALYGTDVTEKNLASDEVLLHFSHLAMQMNGTVVLRKARGLLHELLVSSHIPCTLHDLFCVSSAKDRHMPKVACAGYQACEHGCKYGCEMKQYSSKKSTWKKLFLQ